jgi:hypothetical protein
VRPSQRSYWPSSNSFPEIHAPGWGQSPRSDRQTDLANQLCLLARGCANAIRRTWVPSCHVACRASVQPRIRKSCYLAARRALRVIVLRVGQGRCMGEQCAQGCFCSPLGAFWEIGVRAIIASHSRAWCMIRGARSQLTLSELYSPSRECRLTSLAMARARRESSRLDGNWRDGVPLLLQLKEVTAGSCGKDSRTPFCRPTRV